MRIQRIDLRWVLVNATTNVSDVAISGSTGIFVRTYVCVFGQTAHFSFRRGSHRKVAMFAITAAVALSSLSSASSELTAHDAPRVHDLKQPLQHVAFGSCNDQSFSQTLWSTIAAHKPDLWVWMGDNVSKLLDY